MDFKAFYNLVEHNLRKGGSGIIDKFKLTNADLVAAVLNNDPTAVAESLNAWVNPNKPDGLERYPLPIAVDNNHEIMVGMLLHHKAHPDVRGVDGESALYKAVFWENENIVRLLMDKGAKASFPNLDGSTPIMAAVENGYSNIHAILTNDQEQLKRMQLARDKATHIAMKEKAQNAKARKLKLALDVDDVAENVDIPFRTDQIESFKTKYATYASPLAALLEAIKYKDSEAVRYYAKEIENINAYLKGENALMLAIEEGQEKLAEYLLAQGASLFTKDEMGNYPILNKAVQHQFYDLVSHSCDNTIDTKNILNDKNQSFSPQFLAYKDPRMMDVLLRFGADPFFGGKDGVSPILKALEKGSIAILPVLSKHTVNFSNKIDNKTILQWALELKRADWVNGLLTEGALSNITAQERAKLMEVARGTEDSEMINLMNKFSN